MVIFMLVTCLILMLIACYISIDNDIRKIEIKIDKNLTNIDMGLTRIYDSLAVIYDIISEPMKEERDFLLKMRELKLPSINDYMDDRLNNYKAMLDIIEDLQSYIIKYSDLKSNMKLKKLQSNINEINENLGTAIRLYNINVIKYDKITNTFPKSIVASMAKALPKPLFDVETEYL